MRNCIFDATPDTTEINVQDAVPVILADFIRRPRNSDPSIIEHYIELAIARYSSLNYSLHIGTFAYIRMLEERFTACLTDFLACGVSRSIIEISDGNFCAFLRHRKRRCSPDSHRGTRDDSHFVVKPRCNPRRNTYQPVCCECNW